MARKLLGLGLGLLVLNACSDQPTNPTFEHSSSAWNVAQFSSLPDVAAVDIQLPGEPRPWDDNDAELVTVLQEQDGHAIIAFKLPESARVADTGGRRAAVPRAAFRAGLELVARSGGDIRHVYRLFGGVAARIDPDMGPELRQHPLVDFVEPRQQWRLSSAPMNLDLLSEMVTMASTQDTTWGIPLIRAPEAWSLSTGSGVKLQFIDGGIAPHEDLPSIPSANCGGIYGGCSDGNKFHGTFVAGLAIARDNTFGVIGVAHGIPGIEVFSWGACNPMSEFCDTDQIAAAIDAGKWAGVQVINMSFGAQTSNPAVTLAVAQADSAGIVMVAPAGNRRNQVAGGNVDYPAKHPGVIAVSGVRENKTFAHSSPCPHPEGGSWASEHGPEVDLAAPFWGKSTRFTSAYGDENQGYCGTSFSAPFVSGAAALLWSHNPTWTKEQIVDRLFETAEDLGSSGKNELFGHGLVDVAHALGIEPPVPPDVAIDGPTLIEPDATCSWFSNVSGGAPPYTYQWVNDSHPVGTGSSYTGGVLPGSVKDYFTLRLVVTDSNELSNFDEITVFEDQSAPFCMMFAAGG